ncbi:MAG: heparinase II/III family protein [Flavobacteriales bacterium]|jgi:hypothetical protein|nr:heparinase II/III family protein [Flavobacteriales bacterium]
MRHSILALLLPATLHAAAQAPTVHESRPRMLADADRIAWMQAHHQQPGPFGDAFATVLNAYTNNWITDPDLYMVGTDTAQWTWDWNSFWSDDQAMMTVVLWKINGDPAQLMRCRFLARQVNAHLQSTDLSALGDLEAEAVHRRMSAAGDLVLDWCHDALPVPLRQQLAQVLYAQSRAFMERFITSSMGTSFVSSHNTWNHVYANQNALVLHAADGLTAVQHDTVLQWHELVYDRWVNDFFPVYAHYRDDDGGWNWGAAYAFWGYVDQFQLFDNMRIATGTDWPGTLPWVMNSIDQYLYLVQPDGKCLHWGDGQMSIAGDRVIYRHAAIFQDPRSVWLADHYAQPQYMTWTVPVFQKMLYKDFTLAPVPFPDPLLDWWADKVGLSVSRSSWDDDATLVSLHCAPSKRAAHEHRDNNSFAIFKHTPLLLDAGHYDTYGGSHWRNYYTRTIAHNSICVFDSTEAMTSLGQPAANDGGQIDSPPLQNLGDVLAPQNQRGEWIKWATGDGYQYNIADAALSYDPAKLERFTRRLLYLKPDRVLVLDHVLLNGVGNAQRDIHWTAHFAEQPTMSGTLLSAEVPAHIETYDGPDHTSVHGNGSVAVRTLLPVASTATRVGGAGHESWVDGQDRPPMGPVDMDYYTPGGWRIEVRPQTVTDTVVFLHSISMGDDVNVAQPAGEVARNTTTIAVDVQDTLMLFSAVGDTGVVAHEVDEVIGDRTVHIMAMDMADGTYCLFENGAMVQMASTDGQGALPLTWQLGLGGYHLRIANCNVGVGEVPHDGKDITAFPNPATGRVEILPATHVRTGDRVVVRAAPGTIVRETVYASGVDLSALAPGIYLMEVPRTGSRVRVVVQ